MYEQCHFSLFFLLFFTVTLHVNLMALWLPFKNKSIVLNFLSVDFLNMININKHNYKQKLSGIFRNSLLGAFGFLSYRNGLKSSVQRLPIFYHFQHSCGIIFF